MECWGEGSVGKSASSQAGGPEFESPAPMYQLAATTVLGGRNSGISGAHWPASLANTELWVQ